MKYNKNNIQGMNARSAGMTKSKLNAAIAAVLFSSTLVSAPAQAFDFTLGEVEGTLTSQISAGASWRMEDASKDLYAPGNGGTAGRSNTSDDATQNFEKGETFSQIIKGVHDLELTYENYGAFIRGKYWYDAEMKDGKRAHGHLGNNYEANTALNDDNFSDFAKFSGAELLDAFVYGSFEIGDKPLDVRLGKQVVSWGESTFIQGGVNSINPVDVSAFRRPGAEIKEGLLPVNMLFANMGLTDNLSVEGFYQLEWAKTEIDGCGTYFSTADFAADGCNGVTFASSLPDAQSLMVPGAKLSRQVDNTPKDSGQFGFALRYYAEDVDTEFGAYYLNYHSRSPYINGYRSNTGFNSLAVTGDMDLDFDGSYQIAFPEDIQVLGLTAATNLGSWAVSGEMSYRPDMPIQINGNDLLYSLLTDGITGAGAVDDLLAVAAPGDEVEGFDKYDVVQLQATALKFFDQVLGASRLTLVTEAGMTYINDFNDASEGGHRYGRNSVFGTAAPGVGDGFVTDFAWGYRARANLRYSDVFSGVNLTPSIAWSHDVKGYSPAPAQQFNEGRRAVSLGLKADYMDTYTASISYTNYFGGDFNELKDRDFVSLTVGASF
ncbi:DUF1302 domain-containing protein [Oceanospirillum beijerinckii]|uniref:DUF1302 domain-containing protein n=1 Tax=Oceanospirillum beijerinckii TaxID=64976 RepID=UPI00040B73B4|nr:DUF1302 domain-containing protein [Oceanospirillum beijerinckii]